MRLHPSCAAFDMLKDLLRASLEAGDPVGEALACNCIGVLLQNQENPNMADAIRYHHQHLAVADVPGAYQITPAAHHPSAEFYL
jgi:hypothetical protein